MSPSQRHFTLEASGFDSPTLFYTKTKKKRLQALCTDISFLMIIQQVSLQPLFNNNYLVRLYEMESGMTLSGFMDTNTEVELGTIFAQVLLYNEDG